MSRPDAPGPAEASAAHSGDGAGDGLVVRLLAPDELPLAVPLLAALNPAIAPDVLAERLAASAAYPTYRCAGAFAGDRLVAVAGLWETTRTYSGKQLEPDHVVVLPEVRSQGVGRRLMAWIEALARAEGCETIELNAYLANTRAHAFYAADGFAPLGYHFQKRL